ncbi:MCR_0457 family protein [Acinetobacter sp. WZC-1]|uniref:MCR_0457 family protein n=1 Tax=Acinetobacter sp. WZC-1 TaxID=3459034 RepID=UPI00403DB091
MHSNFIKLLTVGILASTMTFMPQAFAADKKAQKHDENIEVTQQQVTQEELAAIYVLSEICPSLVKKDQKFDQGYSRLVKDYLPDEQHPEAALINLSKQASFKKVLNEARQDAKKAGDKGNLAVCSDVSNYHS